MRWLKNISVALFVLYAGQSLNAQQLTQYTHYFSNPYMINPSLAGHDGVTNDYFIRNWKTLGFDGGNVSNFLSVDGSIFDNKLGFGVSLMNDQMGPLSTQGGYLSLEIQPFECGGGRFE